MKIIITESQKNFLWLLRRLNEPDMIDHMTDIVVEGFDYTKVCDYVTDTKGYIHDLPSPEIDYPQIKFVLLRCSTKTQLPSHTPFDTGNHPTHND